MGFIGTSVLGTRALEGASPELHAVGQGAHTSRPARTAATWNTHSVLHTPHTRSQHGVVVILHTPVCRLTGKVHLSHQELWS